MYKYITKKLLLSLFMGIFIGLGILITYAANITSISGTYNSGDTLGVEWFNDLKTRITNIYGSGGNVGIGTSSPTTKLDVSGNVKATSFIGNASSASNVAWTGVTDRPTNISSFTNDSGYITSVTDNRVNTTGDNITGNLNVSGNVGIGTASPSQKLEVVGGSIKAGSGLIIEVRTTNPASPETGRMWLINP